MAETRPDEHELVRRAREDRDPEAFRLLVEGYRRQVWSVCLRITNNQHDAEDAVQDALVAAWHNLHTFRGEAKFGTWLYRIAANAALAVTRKRNRAPLATEDVPEDLTPSADVAGQVVDSDVVRTALEGLAPQFRSALVLREICDFTYEQIAEHEGIGIQTVKSRINRARNMLREALIAAGVNH